MPTLLASALGAAVRLLNRRARPVTSGTLTLPGLHAPVQVYRDRWGVQHIYAGDNHDLFLAQGFLHAQERMWQMELNRRVAAGTLAAVLGEAALPTDRLTRTLGFGPLAQADLALTGAPELAIVEAYTAGVNAFLARRRLPAEFTLLGLKPEPWTPLDTFGIGRLMIFNLSTGWAAELVRAQLIETLGADRAADLDLHWPADDIPTLPEGVVFNRLTADNILLAEQGPFLERNHATAHGSNAWALAGWRTTTGRPLLCNDMHLRISTPSIWYLNHLEGGDYRVTGVSLPGAPGIEVGHNDRIAWGATLAFTDNQDLFVERLDPDNPQRYEYAGQWVDCAVRREEITIKGKKGQTRTHIEEVRVTRHGPLIGALVRGGRDGLALNSYALRPSRALEGFARLDRARHWDDFVAAMALITAPPLNVLYADVDGNIGHWTAGTLPVRAQGLGTVPAPGWTGTHEWVGEVPFAEMPHAFNPASGYIVSCNHQLMPAADAAGRPYPHFLGLHWMNGYRAQRITAEIERIGQLSLEDCRALHIDFESLPGRALVTRLRGYALTPADADADAALGHNLLLAWDGWLGADSVGGAVYEVTIRKLVENLVAPALGPELFVRFAGGRGPHSLLAYNSEFQGHASVTILAMLDDAASPWVAEAGGRAAVIEKSLGDAVRWLAHELGPDPVRWQWGRLHQMTAPHALAVRKPFDQVFNLGPHPIGGDTDTVCQTAYLQDAPYAATAAAPSYRAIVDLGHLDRSIHIAPSGNSGLLGDPHYGDLLPLWLQGEYVPALWSRSAVEAAAAEHLRLEP